MIRWVTPEGASGPRGLLGGIGTPVWAISYALAGTRAEPWVMDCRLPGIKASVKGATVAALQERAERQLAAFRVLIAEEPS